MDSVAGDESRDVLVLSTIHQAKGLEWSHVFIPRVIEESFPHRRALDEPGGEEEERRIFYVGITRAMNELILSYPLRFPEAPGARPSSPRRAGSSRSSTRRCSSAPRSSRARGPRPMTRGRASRDGAGIERCRPGRASRIRPARTGVAMCRSSETGLAGSHRRGVAGVRGHRRPPPIPPRPRVFRIQVVDEETGRGVPLVELRTVNQVRYVTDSNGVVGVRRARAVRLQGLLHRDEPRLRGRQGQLRLPRRRRSQVTEGGSARIPIRRRNIAERLYRVTGAGIYRDSVLTGDPVPIREPLLNGRVMGQDSVVNAVYRGKVHWFWGDTNRPDYPARQLPRARGHFGAARPRRAGSGEGRGPRLLPRREGLRQADRTHARRRADLDLGPDRAPRPRRPRADVRQLRQDPQHAGGLPARARRVPSGVAAVREGRPVPRRGDVSPAIIPAATPSCTRTAASSTSTTPALIP